MLCATSYASVMGCYCVLLATRCCCLHVGIACSMFPFRNYSPGSSIAGREEVLNIALSRRVCTCTLLSCSRWGWWTRTSHTSIEQEARLCCDSIRHSTVQYNSQYSSKQVRCRQLCSVQSVYNSRKLLDCLQCVPIAPTHNSADLFWH